MDHNIEATVEDGTVATGTADVLRVDQNPAGSLPCDVSNVTYTEQQCDLKNNQVQQAQDDGEVLLVQDLQDFQGVVSAETVVVDDCRTQSGIAGLSRGTHYQQYQPMVVQGFVTNSGEVVHVVQQDVPASSNHRSMQSQAQTFIQHPYQHQPHPQMMHPDLYRLIKMFPDFSPKTLYRIFMMCNGDLKRALDQALFARQFRQLDSAPAYNSIAPSSSPHFHPAPYRTPTRPVPAPQYMQVDHMSGAQPTLQPMSQPPILLYQQAEPRIDPRDPRLHKSSLTMSLASSSVAQSLADADVVQIKFGHQEHGLTDGLGHDLGHSLGLTELDASGDASLGGGGDSLHCNKDGLVPVSTSDSKGLLPDLGDVTMKNSTDISDMVSSQSTVMC